MSDGILFATPCYGGMVTAQHFRSCMNLKEDLTKIGLPHDWLIGWNESLVHRGRMEMVASFLKTEFSHLMWLDADIEFTPDDVAKVWNLDADIGVGVYAMKKRNESWYAAWKDGQLVKDLDQFDGPTSVDYAGTGFMLVKRSAVLRVHDYVTKLYERVKNVTQALPPEIRGIINERFAPSYMGPHGRVPAIFMTPVHNDGLESEDYHFSRMAREAGLKITMDPTVRLKHWGQYAYGDEASHDGKPPVRVPAADRAGREPATCNL